MPREQPAQRKPPSTTPGPWRAAGLYGEVVVLPVRRTARPASEPRTVG